VVVAWFASVPTEPFTHTAGFGGVCALGAACIAFAAAWITIRQRRAADAAALAESQAKRADERRNSEIERCWDRFAWLIENRTILGPVLVLSLLEKLTDAAIRLAEPDLIAFTRELTLQFFAAAYPGVAGLQPPPST
jgi:hypothetical protein